MVVVVFGVSGSGKTTVGRRLARMLGWKFLEGDAYHPPENIERMRAGIPLTDADRAAWLAALAQLVRDTLSAGESAVLACSALKRAYRAALVPGGADAGAVVFVYLEGSYALFAGRLRQRRGHFFPAALLQSQCDALEPPGPGEPAPVIVVSAAPPPEAIVERILSELRLAPAAPAS